MATSPSPSTRSSRRAPAAGWRSSSWRSPSCERGAAEQQVVGQRLLADVVQQAGGVHDRLLALVQPGGAGELDRVVGDGGGVAGGGRVAQRERLQQQPEHALVADVQLVAPAHDLLLGLLALEHGAQQQLAHAEAEHEQADDRRAVDLEPVDGHRGQRRGRELPRQHREVHRAEHRQQRAAAQQHGVAGDHHEVEDVRRDEHDEHGDGERALLAERRLPDPLQCKRAGEREGRVRREVVQQVSAARSR